MKIYEESDIFVTAWLCACVTAHRNHTVPIRDKTLQTWLETKNYRNVCPGANSACYYVENGIEEWNVQFYH